MSTHTETTSSDSKGIAEGGQSDSTANPDGPKVVIYGTLAGAQCVIVGGSPVYLRTSLSKATAVASLKEETGNFVEAMASILKLREKLKVEAPELTPDERDSQAPIEYLIQVTLLVIGGRGDAVLGGLVAPDNAAVEGQFGRIRDDGSFVGDKVIVCKNGDKRPVLQHSFTTYLFREVVDLPVA